MNKKIAIITGAGGLVGIESVRFFSKHFDLIIGIDNDSRGYFFGPNGSVSKNIDSLKNEIKNYEHYPIDIRDRETDKEMNITTIPVKTGVLNSKIFILVLVTLYFMLGFFWPIKNSVFVTSVTSFALILFVGPINALQSFIAFSFSRINAVIVIAPGTECRSHPSIIVG
jgi:hypothetical protein